jgi:hypothetical protein
VYETDSDVWDKEVYTAVVVRRRYRDRDDV